MPLPKNMMDELETWNENFSGRYWGCLRLCQDVLEDELRSCHWFNEKKDPDAIKRRITGRVKETARIVEKLHDRDVASYEELEEQIHDIVGTRVVLDTLDQGEAFAIRLENYGGWEKKQSESIARDDGYYAIRHIDVVYFIESTLHVRCEIQVRSRLQDTWGIWSHPVYEVVRSQKLNAIPPKVRSRLKRLGHTLSLADEIGAELLKEFHEWQTTLSEKLNQSSQDK